MMLTSDKPIESTSKGWYLVRQFVEYDVQQQFKGGDPMSSELCRILSGVGCRIGAQSKF